IRGDMYVQEFIRGEPISAIFVCLDNECVLVGTTQQLVGETWLKATGFHYCGSIGPLPDSSVNQTWLRIGNVMREVGLRGVVGVDAILSGDRLYVVEVNPRYTASVEVLELAEHVTVLDVHASAFSKRTQPLRPTVRQSRCVGKGIYFAPFD